MRKLAALFFLTVLLATAGELFAGSVLDRYDLYAHLLPDPRRDDRLAELIVRHGLTPVMAVLYAIYRGRSPVLLAIAAGGALGLLEILYVRLGVMTYKGWSPLVTAALYSSFFGLVAWVADRLPRWPHWLHVGLFAFAVENFTDVGLHGVLGLWQYHWPGLEPELGDKLMTLAMDGLLVVPVTVLATGRAGTGVAGKVLPGLGVAVLLGIERLGLAQGWLQYHAWNLALAAIRYLALMLLVIWYRRWFAARMEPSATKI